MLSSPRPSLVLAVALAAALALVALPAVLEASHSWGPYHWARTSNPFTVKLGDNLSSSWDSFLATTSSDWSASSVLDTTIVAGGTRPRQCRPTSRRVEVCNASYGNTGSPRARLDVVKARLPPFALACATVLVAAAGPAMAVLCLSSEACPMMAREARHDCHEEGPPQDPPSDCCEAAAAVAKEPLSRPFDVVDPAIPVRGTGASAHVSPVPRAVDRGAGHRGPPGAESGLLALLCTLLI